MAKLTGLDLMIIHDTLARSLRVGGSLWTFTGAARGNTMAAVQTALDEVRVEVEAPAATAAPTGEGSA